MSEFAECGCDITCIVGIRVPQWGRFGLFLGNGGVILGGGRDKSLGVWVILGNGDVIL